MDRFYQKGPHCKACPLCDATLVAGRWARHAQGEHADVVLVGEGPGAVETAFGEAFVGPSGELLGDVTREMNLGMVYLTNTALCSGEKDKAEAAKHCRGRLLAELQALQPRVIVALGNVAMTTLLGCPSGITKRRGIVVEMTLGRHHVPVMPTFHPAAVLRNPSWYQDLKADLTMVATMLRRPQVRITSQPLDVGFSCSDDVGAALRAAERGKYAVLDLETEGLDWTRQRILCAVLGTAQGVFILPQEVVYGSEFRRLLRDTRIAWSGHNAKFDRNFLLAQLGVEVPFKFDTMLASYLLDERGGIHGLKSIARRLYDASDWEDPIQAALRGRVPDGKGKKRRKHYGDIPTETLYRYAALDGHYQYRLTWDLAKELVRQPKLRWVFENLLMPATEALSNAEVRGAVLDLDYLGMLEPQYEARCASLARELTEMAGHTLNPRSPIQVATVVFDDLGVPEHPRYGRSTNWDNVLVHHTDVPFVKKLGEFRAQSKLLDTYIHGLLKRADANTPARVHTPVNIHGTVTGRLCVGGDTLVEAPRDLVKYPGGVPITSLHADDWVYSYTWDRRLCLRRIRWVGPTGYKHVLRVTAQDRRTGEIVCIKVTRNHLVRLFGGRWTPAGDLKVGMCLMCMVRRGIDERAKELGITLPCRWYDDLWHAQAGKEIGPTNHTVIAIEECPPEKVWDLEVEDTHTFIGNGIVLHNSSANPNLQNLPRDNKDIKRAIVASPGHLLVYADFSQTELRMLAWFSHDEWLLSMYREGRDLHGEMAAALFGEGYTGEQRTFAKRLNFGIAYGRSALAVAEDSMYDLGRTGEERYAEARRIEHEFYGRMPGVVRWKGEVYAEVVSQGYLESPVGRRRRFPYVPERDASRAALFREAVNFLPQSAASDATLLSFIRCDREGLRPILTVHDSILCDVPEGDAREASACQQAIMVGAARELYGDMVPFATEGGVGTNWGDVEH